MQDFLHILTWIAGFQWHEILSVLSHVTALQPLRSNPPTAPSSLRPSLRPRTCLAGNIGPRRNCLSLLPGEWKTKGTQTKIGKKIKQIRGSDFWGRTHARSPPRSSEGLRSARCGGPGAGRSWGPTRSSPATCGRRKTHAARSLRA